MRGRWLCGAPGVYERAVVVDDGQERTVVVVRFRCRGRGPRRPADRTFSVLPADVLPRRRWSLGWLLKVALWCSDSLVAGLDRLSDAGMVVEARQLARLLTVLGVGCERLRQHPVVGLEIETEGGRRRQATALSRALNAWQAAGRGPPSELVMTWYLQMRRLLLDVRVS